MARAPSKWSKSDRGVWVPGVSRRLLLAGGSAGAASLLIACGSDGGLGMGGPAGSGGKSGSGGAGGGAAAGTGGAGPAGAGGGSSSSGGSSGGTGGGGDSAGSGGSSSTGGASGEGGTGGGGADDAGGVSADSGTAPDASSAMPGGTPSCVVRPTQTEGPFFTDFKLNRSDIRSEPGASNAKPGLPLRIVIRVGQMTGEVCQAYQGAMVDLWQCDARGVYSGYGQEGTAGMKYLRGYQLADSTGTVEFLTIYPGAYAGRAVHLHFKIRTSSAGGKGTTFTSQLYFPEDINDQVFGKAQGYGSSRVKNASDGIYRDGGDMLIPKMSMSNGGWLGQFDIGLRV